MRTDIGSVAASVAANVDGAMMPMMATAIVATAIVAATIARQ